MEINDKQVMTIYLGMCMSFLQDLLPKVSKNPLSVLLLTCVKCEEIGERKFLNQVSRSFCNSVIKCVLGSPHSSTFLKILSLLR